MMSVLRSEEAAIDGLKIRVLLIDDELEEVQGLLRMLGDAEDLALSVITNSDEVLTHARRSKPDVILQSLSMEGSGGFDLLQRFRRTRGLAQVPVIVLGSREDASIKAQAFREGADDYLIKMPDPVELLARIRHHAERRCGAVEQQKAYERLARAEEELREMNVILGIANEALGGDKKIAEQEARDTRARLESITTLGAQLNAYQDLDLLMERILLEARKSCAAESGAVFLVQDDALSCDYVQNDQVERRISAGEDLIIPRNTRRLDLSSISGTVALTGRACRVEDAYAIPESENFLFDTTRDVALGYRTQAVLSLPLRTSSEKILGVLQLANPLQLDGEYREFTAEDQHIIEHFAGLATVALERALLTRSMVMRMISMAELRDPTETGLHVQRVAGYTLELFDGWARKNGMDEKEYNRQRDRLRIAAMLHDVGKVGIPDAILKKPGSLEEHEFALMQQHTVIGARLFAGLRTDFDDMAREVALHHHERWDGNGYPGPVDPSAKTPDSNVPIQRGLSGKEIPIFARMVAIADVYDALSTQRAYKNAWSEDRVIEFLRSESGGHFDPELVEILLERIDRVRRISLRYRDEHEAEDY